MPAPRKYDQETRDRAVRLYQERRRDHANESAVTSRRRVGELLDVNPGTLRGWIDRAEIDAGARPGVTSEENAELARLKKENAELRRANEILKTASAFFAAAELDRKLS
jgi:transposase-like protein